MPPPNGGKIANSAAPYNAMPTTTCNTVHSVQHAGCMSKPFL